MRRKWGLKYSGHDGESRRKRSECTLTTALMNKEPL